MKSEYKEVNEMLLSLHNQISGRNDTIEDVINDFISTPLEKPLVHNGGISGKIARNRMVNPDDYYRIMD